MDHSSQYKLNYGDDYCPICDNHTLRFGERVDFLQVTPHECEFCGYRQPKDKAEFEEMEQLAKCWELQVSFWSNESVDNYKESHVFPSGLKIEFEPEEDIDVDEHYVRELNAISSQEELVAFVERWRYLFPEIVAENLSFERLNSLRGNIQIQNEYSAKAKSDPSCEAHINLLLPVTMAFYVMKAKEYEVCVSVVILQLWNSGCYVESQDGTWTFHWKSKPSAA